MLSSHFLDTKGSSMFLPEGSPPCLLDKNLTLFPLLIRGKVIGLSHVSPEVFWPLSETVTTS